MKTILLAALAMLLAIASPATTAAQDFVYDIRDAGVNALAGLMAIAASLALPRARRRDLFDS
jgi:hypothetical protein